MFRHLGKSEANARSRSAYLPPSPQDPAKRAQFRIALLGGGARPRECARGEPRRRPGNETSDESARETKVGGPRPQAKGSRSEAEKITKLGDSSSCSAFARMLSLL